MDLALGRRELPSADVAALLHLRRACERVARTLERVDRQPALDPTTLLLGSRRQGELLALSARRPDVVMW